MQNMKASDFNMNPGLLEKYELYLNGKWQTFYAVDAYRMPNSPVLFYTDFSDGEVSVPRDELIQVRPKQ
jgi:hypothetical protein